MLGHNLALFSSHYCTDSYWLLALLDTVIPTSPVRAINIQQAYGSDKVIEAAVSCPVHNPWATLRALTLGAYFDMLTTLSFPILKADGTKCVTNWWWHAIFMLKPWHFCQLEAARLVCPASVQNRGLHATICFLAKLNTYHSQPGQFSANPIQVVHLLN